MWVYNRKFLVSFFLFNFLFIVATNSVVLFDLIDEWWSTGPYNHGLLGLALALYLIWKNREQLGTSTGGVTSLILFSLANLLLLIANLSSIGQLQLLSLFIVILTLLLCLYGQNTINKLFLPLVMIFLSLPIWNLLQIPLRELSTWVSFNVVQQLGFDIIRKGYMLLTPSGGFLVEEACSGLSFLLAAALYAVFVAQINHLSRSAGWLFLLLAISIAIVANWIRISAIIIVGSQTAMQHFIIQDHLTFGWLVFAGCFIPLIIIGNLYFSEQANRNKQKVKIKRENFPVSKWFMPSVSLILILFAGGYQLLIARFDPLYQFKLPPIANYHQLTLNSTSSPNWHPISHGATSEAFHYFSQGDDLIQVYLANYARQRQGEEMIYIGNRLFDKQRWLTLNQQTVLLNSSALKQVNLLSIARNKEMSRFIAYWYFVDGQFIADKKKAKLHQLLATFKGQPGATLIAVAFDYNNQDKAAASKAINRFIRAFSAQAIDKQQPI